MERWDAYVQTLDGRRDTYHLAVMTGRVTGHLDLLLLGAVDSVPSHGYGVITALRGRSGGAFDLTEGSVYPALQRLENAALLTSEWHRWPAGGGASTP